MSDLHQQLMDQAYARFQANRHWSRDQFIMRLNWLETVAVLTGNLNYQVENGGFAQWHDNGYSEHTKQLLEVLNEINTDTSKQVVELVLEFMGGIRELEDEEDWEVLVNTSDDISDRFYAINKQLLSDVEDFLHRELHDAGCNPNE
jgi:hypothetical protein